MANVGLPHPLYKNVIVLEFIEKICNELENGISIKIMKKPFKSFIKSVYMPFRNFGLGLIVIR